MRAAVTGAGGFIGGAVLPALQQRGIETTAHIGPQYFDICDVPALLRHFLGCDAVVHLAGPPSVADSLRHPVEYVRAHVLGTASVLQAMREADVPFLVYISSAEVYGTPQADRVREDQTLSPRSPYAAAKASAEMLIRAAALANAVGGYIIRPFSVYGNAMPESSLLATILQQACSSNQIVVNDLTPVRDYCFVGDLAELIAAAVSNPQRKVVTLNAAYGKGYSVAQTIEAAGTALGRPLVGKEGGPKRPDAIEVRRLVANVDAARRELGWHAKRDLVEGLRTMQAATGP